MIDSGPEEASGFTMPRVPLANTARFGPFNLDLRAGELHKGGRRIRLQEQPFRILTMLLEHSGEVVTREEVQNRLWPNDTIVEFDHSINSAIKRLRDALGDTAQRPKYLETVARRGYRLLLPVEWVEVSSDKPAGTVAGQEVGAAVSSTPSSVVAGAHTDRNDSMLAKLRFHAGRNQSSRVAESGHTGISPSEAGDNGMAVVLDKDAAELVSQPAKSRSLRTGLALGMVVAVTLGFFVWRRRDVKSDQFPTDRIRSLVVLPLENISGHKDEEYFADGMTDELITTLAKLPSLRIISRTSAMHYKGTNKPLAEIARELDVQAVVEGEVLHSGDRVRITAQLIEATTDRHLWAETYQGDVKDVFALQREVARAIANEIQVKLTPQADIHLSTVHQMKPDAYEAHLKSRYFLHNQRGAEGARKSIEYSQQAVQLDPNAALAYAGLAEAYVNFGLLGMAPAHEVFPKAMIAAQRALQLDPSLVAAHTSLGDIAASYTYNWALAERELTRAVQLGPNDPDAHEVYARYLLSMGRLNEALLEMRWALALDPLSQLINRDMGRVLYYSRRYDEAIKQLKKAIELNPMNTVIYRWLGWAYEAKGMNDEAVQVFLKDFAVNGDTPETIEGLRKAYARAGMTGYWRASLGVGELGRDPYQMGATLAQLGDRDHAFGWLQKALDARTVWIKYIKVDPRLDTLRADPRFRDLLRRVGLPP